MPEGVDENMIDSFSNTREELLRREAEGERMGQGTDLSEDWDRWREQIEAESPGSRTRGERRAPPPPPPPPRPDYDSMKLRELKERAEGILVVGDKRKRQTFIDALESVRLF